LLEHQYINFVLNKEELSEQWKEHSTVSACRKGNKMSMKITVFWVVVPWSLVEILVDDGGSMYLSNISKCLPDYVAQHS
jgi:hypothetical protein